MSQKFYAHPDHTFAWPNGAIGYRPGGNFDSLGPYAKVQNCPVQGTKLRLTCYASWYGTGSGEVPANTRYKKKYVAGHFAIVNDNIVFIPKNKYKEFLGVA